MGRAVKALCLALALLGLVLSPVRGSITTAGVTTSPLFDVSKCSAASKTAVTGLTGTCSEIFTGTVDSNGVLDAKLTDALTNATLATACAKSGCLDTLLNALKNDKSCQPIVHSIRNMCTVTKTSAGPTYCLSKLGTYTARLLGNAAAPTADEYHNYCKMSDTSDFCFFRTANFFQDLRIPVGSSVLAPMAPLGEAFCETSTSSTGAVSYCFNANKDLVNMAAASGLEAVFNSVKPKITDGTICNDQCGLKAARRIMRASGNKFDSAPPGDKTKGTIKVNVFPLFQQYLSFACNTNAAGKTCGSYLTSEVAQAMQSATATSLAPAGQARELQGQGQGQSSRPSTDAKGQAPAGQGQGSAGQGQSPAGKGQAPAGQGQAPAGQGQAPAGQGQAPAGQGQAPAGQGQAPAGQGQAPAGKGQAAGGQAPPGKAPAGDGSAQGGRGPEVVKNGPTPPPKKDRINTACATINATISTLGCCTVPVTNFRQQLARITNDATLKQDDNVMNALANPDAICGIAADPVCSNGQTVTQVQTQVQVPVDCTALLSTTAGINAICDMLNNTIAALTASGPVTDPAAADSCLCGTCYSQCQAAATADPSASPLTGVSVAVDPGLALGSATSATPAGRRLDASSNVATLSTTVTTSSIDAANLLNMQLTCGGCCTAVNTALACISPNSTSMLGSCIATDLKDPTSAASSTSSAGLVAGTGTVAALSATDPGVVSMAMQTATASSNTAPTTSRSCRNEVGAMTCLALAAAAAMHE